MRILLQGVAQHELKDYLDIGADNRIAQNVDEADGLPSRIISLLVLRLVPILILLDLTSDLLFLVDAQPFRTTVCRHILN